MRVPRRVFGAGALAAVGGPVLARAGLAAPLWQELAPGALVLLAGTPHIWVADEQSVLHWNGDTRALSSRRVNWDSRLTVTLNALLAMRRGDPWLSAGLLKDGDPIYLVKWETDWPRPKLLHIQNIQDVELFGISGSNYGTFVMDRTQWERQFGMSVASLERGVLPPATSGAIAGPTVTPGPTATPVGQGSSLPRAASERTVAGMIAETGQRDRYTIEGRQGQVLEVRMDRAAGSNIDPFLELLDPSGRRLTDADDTGLSLDAYIWHILPQTGTYTVVARNLEAGTGAYSLWWALDRVGRLASGMALTADLTRPEQVDAYRFEGRQGQALEARLEAAPGSRIDPLLALIAPNGTVEAIDDDSGGGLTSLIRRTLASTGTYMLAALDFSGTSGAYRIEMTLR